MKAPVIRDWSIGFPPFALNYKLPMALHNACIRGLLCDSPKDKVGKLIILSNINYLDTKFRIVKTNGRIFTLDDPEPLWEGWLQRMKINISEYNINCL